MHCQKILNGPGTVLNGFPSKAACKKVIKQKQKYVEHKHICSRFGIQMIKRRTIPFFGKKHN
jgi:hypothetical protein